MTNRQHISQREARQLRKRVAKLEEMIRSQNNCYAKNYPGGVHLGYVSWQQDTHLASAVYTARLLRHAVIAVSNGERRFDLYAVKQQATV